MNIKCPWCQSQLVPSNELLYNCKYTLICSICSDIKIKWSRWKSPIVIGYDDKEIKTIIFSFVDLDMRLLMSYLTRSIRIFKMTYMTDYDMEQQEIELPYIIPNLLDIPIEDLKEKVKTIRTFQ